MLEGRGWGRCGEDHIPPTGKRSWSPETGFLLGTHWVNHLTPPFAWKWRASYPRGRREEQGKGLQGMFLPFLPKQKEKLSLIRMGKEIQNIWREKRLLWTALEGEGEKKGSWVGSEGLWTTGLPLSSMSITSSPSLLLRVLVRLRLMAASCPRLKGEVTAVQPKQHSPQLSGGPWVIHTIAQTTHEVGTRGSQPLAFRQLISLGLPVESLLFNLKSINLNSSSLFKTLPGPHLL